MPSLRPGAQTTQERPGLAPDSSTLQCEGQGVIASLPGCSGSSGVRHKPAICNLLETQDCGSETSTAAADRP